MKRFLWLGWIAFLFLFCIACGDTFRPILIPNIPTFPDPKAAHSIVALNDNGSSSPGSVLVVDVSGDSEVSIRNVGITPVHAVQQTANQVLVVNQATTTTLVDSLTKLVFSGTVISGTPTTISLPPNSAPNFVATTESSQAYVLLPSFAPDPANPTQVVPSLGVISTVSNELTTTAPVGNKPVAMVETVDTKKLFVANQGDGSISGFNTIDRSLRNNPLLKTSSPPIWLSARSDSQRVYVLEQDGTLASLDTTSTAGPDTLTESTIKVPNATTMVYDGHLNRLYIPAGVGVAVVDVSQSAPTQLVSVPITPLPPSARGAQDPCAAHPTTTLNTIAAIPLPDGSRAYFGAFYEDEAGDICPQLTVINTSDNVVKMVAPVPGFPNFDTLCASTRFRFTLAAGGDSSRVYLASCDGGGVNVIDTSTDTFLVNLPAPSGSRQNNPPQNPIFLIAGP